MEKKEIKAGDRIKVKSLEEIKVTLDGNGFNNGIYFNGLCMSPFAGTELTVTAIEGGDYQAAGYWWRPEWVQPIDEPVAEAAPVDLCELLAGCEGMELYSTVEGPMVLIAVKPNNEVYQIRCADRDGDESNYTREGYYLVSSRDLGGECVLFPSREQRDWSKWKKPKPWEPKNGETFCYVNALLRPLLIRHDGTDYARDLIESGNFFRTEEEAREAAEEIRKCLKAFHERKR